MDSPFVPSRELVNTARGARTCRAFPASPRCVLPPALSSGELHFERCAPRTRLVALRVESLAPGGLRAEVLVADAVAEALHACRAPGGREGSKESPVAIRGHRDA